MGVVILAAAVLGAGPGALPAHGGKGSVANRLTLVQAQCEGPPPAPCSSLRFTRATATVRNVKQPGPTCPKTGDDPSENNAGDVRLDGVARAGAPFAGTLTVEVVLKTTFAADPNGTCSLAGVQIATPSLLGTLTCRNGACRGRLVAAACLPPQCADTPLVSELVSLIVKDDAGQPLATPGTAVPPARGDAS
jgi:hypothetical protein